MDIRTKICGIKTPDIASFAVDSGAEFIGLIFFEKSPRNISFEQAKLVASSVKNKASIITVLVNPDDEFIADLLSHFTPDYIQLHGSETPERVKEIKDKFGIKLIKAISVNDKGDIEKAKKYEALVEFTLFDAKPPKNSDLPGGNAVSFDWDILKNINLKTPWFLSGGLHSGNIEEAITTSKAKFIDVSSGVEKDFGKKDKKLIKNFLKTVQNLNI